MLGFELGRVLREHAGDELYDLVERVRALAKARRAGDAAADDELKRVIAGLDGRQIEQLIRALSVFFDLANLAEDRHRVRVLRARESGGEGEERKESIGDAVATLRARGVGAGEMQGLLDRLHVEPVFTAHPTEAKRRTVRSLLRRLRGDLVALDERGRTPRERDRLIARLQADLAVLWEVEPLRPRKPDVLEEVRRSLFVVDPLWEAAPWLQVSLRRAVARHYPEASGDTQGGGALRAGRFLSFGTWIGGDRDGNPYVTADVTRQTLHILRSEGVRRHSQEARRLAPLLAVSTRRRGLSDELRAALDEAVTGDEALRERMTRLHPHEGYRMWLEVVRARLEVGYRTSDELIRDLRLMQNSLRQAGHGRLADGELREWIDRAHVFGLHIARLDIREDSRALHAAVAELAAAVGAVESPSEYEAMDDAARVRLLSEAVDVTRASRLNADDLSEAAREKLDLFTLVHREAAAHGGETLGMAIVSMTHRAGDVLPMLWLLRLGAAACGEREPAASLPIVPLFETIDDLNRAPDILDAMMASEGYRRHLEASGNVQCCMIGYSDSTKDGGYLAANVGLQAAQRRLAAYAAKRGVELMLFHGRGGALGRGGGPAARGILSLPPRAVEGRLRITEQGEVLAERYDDPQVARRHLEQITWATMLVSAGSREGGDAAAGVVGVSGERGEGGDGGDLLEQAAERSRAAYRELIEDPAFIAYFEHATPIGTIESLQIGSRPSRRKSGDGGERKLSDLRAIPYTFAWTQSRHLLTAFYGLGTGLEPWADRDLERLRAMYREQPGFRATIDNAELALAKADPAIAREYAALVPDEKEGLRLWERFAAEYERSRRVVLAVTGRAQLLDSVAWLQRSIRVRNPYVDPLNLIQVELLRRKRTATGDEAREEIEELLRLCVQGIAAGLRTTG